MKKSILVIFMMSSLQMIAQNAGEAVKYMESFTSQYEEIQKSMWDYTKAISHGRSARKVEKTRMQLISDSDKALQAAKKVKGYNSNTAYRDSVIRYFTIVNLVLREDYEKLVDMEEVAEQSYDLMEAYMLAKELANDKQTAAANMIAEEQRKFAEANNIQLVESSDKLDRKMEVASKVYAHYNEVYLIFFKSYKQEFYLIDAIGKRDMSAIEQNKEALLATVEEGIDKLNAVELYENDPTVVEATNNLFKFYKNEAEGIQIVQDYILKTEKFNKVKEAFDAKKEKNRTQEDVDQYNEAVNEMNAAINAYNTWNDKMNETRSKYIDAWNKAAEKFTDKHIPKGR